MAHIASPLLAIIFLCSFLGVASAQVQNPAPSSAQLPDGSYDVYVSPPSSQIGGAISTGYGGAPEISFTNEDDETFDYEWEGSRYVLDNDPDQVLTFIYDQPNERWLWSMWERSNGEWSVVRSGYLEAT